METGEALWKVGGIALVGVVALIVVRQCRPEWAPLLRIAAAMGAIGVVISLFSTVVSTVEGMGGGVLDGSGWDVLVRARGIALLTEITAGICRDSGEGEIASWGELAGKLEMILLSLPLVGEILEMASDLLGGGV